MAQSTIALLLAASCSMSSFALGHWVERQRFYRRDWTGCEVFPHYRGLMLARFNEHAALTARRLLRAAAVALLFVSLMLRWFEVQP